MKFRKKPVVIDAIQFVDGLTPAELHAFLGSLDRVDVSAEHMKGVKGEFYPCKPDIFAATYEAVE